MSQISFPNFSGLKPKKTKFEIAGIGVLNGVQVALCDMKFVNLNNETVRILGVHFSYNKNLEQEFFWTYPQNRKYLKIMATANFTMKN